MSKLKSISTTAIALLVSTSVLAQSDDTKQDPSKMPMMQDENGNMVMMNPKLMETMMADGHSANMPMMNMQMMHRMMHQMNAMEHDYGQGPGKGHGTSMMGGGMGNMMMNPQMMQMRMQHMLKMEQLMENIESLLSQILESSKSK